MMKSIIYIAVVLFTFSCASNKKATVDNNYNTVTNPILPGFYPDPSLTRHGDDYYLVTSTFSYFPGLPIFHSKDLVSWRQIGHAMDREEQLPIGNAGVSRGLFAPAITTYKDKFYIVNTLIDKGGNYVITADDPAGPWSNPTYMPNANGIDPSIYFDEESDKAYLVYNSIAPDNKPLYGGHRTIRMRSFDYNTLQAGDDELMLVDGGVDISKHPVWIEAPHIFKKDDYFYLICAEGGTAYNHSEVVFRSRDVKGPYEPYENNPILTQRDINTPRDFQVTTAGHAEFVEFGDGSWWAVFLATRPYGDPTDDHFNIGRETFIAPVTWKDGWPHILPQGELLPETYKIAKLPTLKTSKLGPVQTGQYYNDFDEPLGFEWIYLRNPESDFDEVKNGKLHIKAGKNKLTERKSPNAVFTRLQHIEGETTMSLCFTPKQNGDLAGLTVFQNEEYFYLVGKNMKGDKTYVSVYESSSNGEGMTTLAEIPLDQSDCDVDIKMVTDGFTFGFLYRLDQNSNYKSIVEGLDGTKLSTKIARGFVGSTLGLYAYSANEDNEAVFDAFSSIRKK